MEILWPNHHHRVPPPWLKKVIDPLKQQVKDRGLWACHLGPELGGKGFGQVKLSLMNEILAPYQWGPTIFGVQGPDTGNAEIIAHYGTAEQKERYLRPLLEGELFSAFSMTEPHAGADPTQFICRATRDGDRVGAVGRQVLHLERAARRVLVVLAVTDPGRRAASAHVDVPAAQRHPGHRDRAANHVHGRGRGRHGPSSRPLPRRADAGRVAAR